MTKRTTIKNTPPVKKTAVKAVKATAKTAKAPKAPKMMTAPMPPLERGQKWQLLLGYAEIVHVGKFLLDYRFHRLENQRRVPLETGTIAEFTATLKKNKAQLVDEIPTAPAVAA
jgi:hypothetical protein